MQSQKCWQMDFYLSDLENKTKKPKLFLSHGKDLQVEHMSV